MATNAAPNTTTVVPVESSPYQASDFRAFDLETPRATVPVQGRIGEDLRVEMCKVLGKGVYNGVDSSGWRRP